MEKVQHVAMGVKMLGRGKVQGNRSDRRRDERATTRWPSQVYDIDISYIASAIVAVQLWYFWFP